MWLCDQRSLAFINNTSPKLMGGRTDISCFTWSSVSSLFICDISKTLQNKNSISFEVILDTFTFRLLVLLPLFVHPKRYFR